MKRLILIAMVVLLSSSIALAQDFCNGNFDYDSDVDADDVEEFLKHFGRHQYNNPCPPDGPAPVPKTWQWISYSTGDDGDYEHGAMWPNPRFTDNENDTITDNLTGLMWLKDASCITSWYPGFDSDDVQRDGAVTWQHGLDFVAGINDGSYADCGGNPPYNDWRLPNIQELQSLIHYGFNSPAVPCTAGPCKWEEGDPFVNLQYESFYWSSTTASGGPDAAWVVYMITGEVPWRLKWDDYHIWPVRGGQ